MLLLSEDQYVATRGRASAGARLEPRLTTDGKYALPEATATDAAHSATASILAAATTGTPSGYDTTLATPAILLGGVGGRHMQVNCAEQAWSLQKPASNVYRFEVRSNDFVTSTDAINGTRRSELVSPYASFTGVSSGPDRGYFAGETVWQAWSAVLGDHNGFLAIATDARFAYGMQWHSDDFGVAARGPVLVVDYSNSALRIKTRSSADFSNGNGNPVTRYSTSVPAKGTKVDFVMQVTLGQTGHLNAWINGTQVVNADCPIGYYATDVAAGKALAHPHWGIYTFNQNLTDVLYVANPEVGIVDLSGRVGSPLVVPDLSPWN